MESFYEYPLPPDQEPIVLNDAAVAEAEAQMKRWEIRDDMFEFVRVLDEWDRTFEWLLFLEKPWKWSKEYVIWVAAGKGDLTDDMAAAFDAVN